MFSRGDGAEPNSALIEASDGNLYGATSEGGDLTCNSGIGCGTLFEISGGRNLTTLHFFNASDGQSPMALLQSTLGGFFGATNAGGDLGCNTGYGCGTLFYLNMGLGPFVAFIRDYGGVGETGGILGQGFTGTTSVEINGVPASFTVTSDTLIRATVPDGATSGYVTVTTPSGILTSNVPFHVIP